MRKVLLLVLLSMAISLSAKAGPWSCDTLTMGVNAEVKGVSKGETCGEKFVKIEFSNVLHVPVGVDVEISGTFENANGTWSDTFTDINIPAGGTKEKTFRVGYVSCVNENSLKVKVIKRQVCRVRY